MLRPSHHSLTQFWYAILNLSPKRQWLLILLFFLAFTYPGHNSLQQIILYPGNKQSFLVTTPLLAEYPESDNTPEPHVYAKSYLVQDLTSKTILTSRYPDTPLPPASITKLMTALVVLDAWPDPSTVLTVKNLNPAIGQTIELLPGEQLTRESLLEGLLIYSGNDAALTFADNFPGGYVAFVAAMNQKAAALHLNHTTYKNPSGIDQYGHVTTARDIATLASIALSDERISSIVTKDNVRIVDITETHVHDLKSTDELLRSLPGLKGGKTGWTTKAGECFVSYVERDGHGIITVVLGSSDRFGDTRTLVEWAYTHHNWIKIDVSAPF